MRHITIFIFLSILSFSVSCGQQKKYIQYKVQQGETLRNIAQKLKMKKRDLLRLNPDVQKEPKANSFLVVPEQKKRFFSSRRLMASKKNQSILQDTLPKKDSLALHTRLKDSISAPFILHEVVAGDTFYSLSTFYEVPQEQLVRLNPYVQKELPIGALLKIKRNPEQFLFNPYTYTDSIVSNTQLKAALLLPFRAENYLPDSISLKEAFVTNANLVNIATDFYLGAEIAVDSLRNQGIAVDLEVFDTGTRNSTTFDSIVHQVDLSTNDVIFGPLYSDEVQSLAATLPETPLVYPVYSSGQAKFTAATILTTSPDKSVFRKELETYIKANLIGGNVIIVSDEKQATLRTANAMKIALATDTTYIDTITVLSPIDGYIEKELFLALLKPNRKNWVVLATDKNVVVSDVINSLISLPEETAAKLFTFTKGRVYDNEDNRKLAKLGFTFVSEDFYDPEATASTEFNKQFLENNHTLPSYYATKGFDITYDILMRLASGKPLEETFTLGASQRVETRFDYTTGSSGNEGLYIIQYNSDLTLTKLK